MKIAEIINAWIISFNPNEEQKTLALNRVNICDTCEYKKYVIKKPICSACGCPISKKIFSEKQNACPKGKWDDVDDEFFTKVKSESNRLL
jgi:ribosomal protein L37E